MTHQKTFPITIQVLFMIVAFGLGFAAFGAGKTRCKVDSDCKLIFSNCGCKATHVTDPATMIKSDRVCAWNPCHATDVKAVCYKGKCMRNDRIKKKPQTK